jgi:alkylresorcinol/alkylpyrone synthase
VVLFVAVELCALTFRAGDASKANIIAAALFGDGAAAVVLSTEGDGPALLDSTEHTWPDSRDVMGWNIAEDGLGVVFSRDIPTLVARDLRPVADRFLARQGMAVGDLDRLVCHPGGTKVVAALESAFEREPGTLSAERKVLRHHGNMSSPTVLFVLDAHLKQGIRGRSLMTALGPGFTAGLALLEQA